MALFASQSFASEAVASQSFADLAIAFNKQVSEQLTNMTVSLPAGFRLQDAFQSAVARELSQDFYRKYYADEQPRTLILGINPGRHGAGLTGIPFTDSQRLESKLELPAKGIRSYEPSSTFVYEVIEKMGGAMDFYRKFFFQSPLPLCLLRKNERNNWCNANYYDRKDLTQALQPLMQWAIGELLRLPLKRGKVFLLGDEQELSVFEILEPAQPELWRAGALAAPPLYCPIQKQRKGAIRACFLRGFG